MIDYGVSYSAHASDYAIIGSISQAQTSDIRDCDIRRVRDCARMSTITLPPEAEEIFERLDALGWTQRSLAEHLGIEENKISKVRKGERQFKAAEVLKARDWLLKGEARTRPDDPDDDDDVEIDSVDFAYGMGGAFLDADAVVERVKLPRKWLRQFTESPPSVLGIAQGIGDSMEPLFYDRDLVIFDRSARLHDHLSDKTWVFALGNVGMIKRLRPLPDGTIKIMSANRTYPDEIAAPGEIHVIGRVVASVRRH